MANDLHTEEEAKEQWCPQAHNGSDQSCIGSRCMAWRSGGYEDREGPVLGFSGTIRTVRKRVGYCGLAGKP